MSDTQVVELLKDVQFYTALDPYYYIVDNRPLGDLDHNIRLVAAASDASAGSSNRASLSAATAAYAHIGFGEVVQGDPVRQGRGMFSSGYELFGLAIRFTHGYLIRPEDQGGSPAYIEPKMAIHDAVTSLTPQVGRGATVQVSFRDSTINDRVPSSGSDIQVAVISLKQGTSPGAFPQPDPNNVAIMHIDIPPGAVQLTDDYLTPVNFRTIAQSSDILKTSKVSYSSHLVNLSAGTRNINLSGTGLDTNRMSAVEVFVQGVNQFDWAYNSTADQIVLAAPLVQAAEVRLRQTNLEFI